VLERFHVPEEIAHRVSAADLRTTVARIFEKCGVPEDDARLGADVLVASDLRGVETHGVSNTLRGYVRAYSEGKMNPRPDWRVVRETASCATVDCDKGLGLIVTPKVMELAIEKARNTGVGMISLANGGHLGMAGYHAMMALEHDMIGVCTTACPPTTLPTFSAEPALGTNPIAVAAPAGSEVPFVFDAAMASIAYNKISLAKRLGVATSAGWIAGPDGNPLMEEAPVPEKWYMLPLGATRELGSHKGYGLGVVVDILSAILNGNAAAATGRFTTYGHCVAAYSIDAFIDVDEFKRGMDEYLKALRSLKPAPGHERVVYAGMLEIEEEKERLAKGIPLHPEVIDWFRGACEEMGVEFIL